MAGLTDTRLAGLLGRFVTVGGLSVGTDVAVLYVLHTVLGVHLVIATAAGYLASLGVNYSLNHAWVFGSQGEHRRRMLRYFALVGVNVLTTFAFVVGLTDVGLYYLIAKVVAVAVNAVINFTGFRFWVFRVDSYPQGADQPDAAQVGAAAGPPP